MVNNLYFKKKQDEAIKYFRNKLNLSDKDLYIPLINFELP